MVAAVYYYATPDDHAKLLDHIGEPVKASVHPWPLVDCPPTLLTRDQALTMPQVMVVHRDFGPPSVIRPGDAAMTGPTRAGVFNRVNWDRLRPAVGEGLVDSNASPVLVWEPGPVTDSDIRVSKIGSQTDAMGAISADYKRWANRIMGWIRRQGTKVWGLERSAVRADLDLQLSFVNTVYALPGALSVLGRGALGR